MQGGSSEGAAEDVGGGDVALVGWWFGSDLGGSRESGGGARVGSLKIRVVQNGLGIDYIYMEKKGVGSSDQNPTVENR